MHVNVLITIDADDGRNFWLITLFLMNSFSEYTIIKHANFHSLKLVQKKTRQAGFQNLFKK